MKHKPSTKSDSYKCRIIRLLKMNRLYWKTTVFFFLFEWWSSYTEQTVKCEHDYAIYTLRILPDDGRKEKVRESRRKQNSDIRPTTVWSACGPGFKGLSWLARTNKEVWERRGAASDNH